MKLNASMREEAANAASLAAYGEQIKAAEVARDEAGEALYVKCMGGQARLAQINTAADDVFKLLGAGHFKGLVNNTNPFYRHETITFNIGGRHRRFAFPQGFRLSRHRYDVEAACELGVAFERAADACHDLESKLNQFRREAMGVLKSVTTVAKLLKVWPEIEPYLPTETEVKTTALAPTITNLNAALGGGA